MVDLFETLRTPQEALANFQPKEYSVSEISSEIKKCVENNFNRIRVKGEIFGGKRADSGHWYLTLKDENALLSAVIWRGTAARLPFKPEDGLEVVATGKITTFSGKSSYQMVIEQLEISGTGALLKLLEERKQKFAAEGLFDPAHKKKIPYLPTTIGVVTSPTGAVIRDIIHRVTDRFPSHILLWPSLVQGEGAAEQIAKAIRGFNDLPKQGNIKRPDVLIVARGGGSLEDLWAFNEEVVIRAVYDSEIPIISAVGHETDTMLIDYVADVRAPTPTGAAEFAVPVRSELLSRTATLQSRIYSAIGHYFSERQNILQGLTRGIPKLDQILAETRQKLDERIERFELSFRNYLQNKKQQIAVISLKPYHIKNILEKNEETLNNLSIRLTSVSVDSVLQRGFAWVKDEKQQTVYNLAQAQKAKHLNIQFIDGTLTSNQTSKKNEKTLQGDLFDLL
ncbi:MAG: exodeoxyribonuclease VII large subunit [Alphaproteobacteria bacterium]|nr:exodeoxyribonuclease VII large subunit [Alphaproteobacteria bacterium]MBQ8678033.1 exodeoxyribonuclease VII large subunit [Alphaproteobacteria bacterium]